MIDLSNSQIGRLRVVEYNRQGEHRGKWKCICECGQVAFVLTGNLTNATTRSCGCLKRDIITKHGHSPRVNRSLEYNSWACMISRCTNPNNRRYSRYGGRGISVCERWLMFENFLSDMGHQPEGKHSLDRVDNNGNYEPGNCRWATPAQQNRNNSNTRLLTFEGRTQCVTDWALEKRINRNTLSKRLRSGWPIEKALTAETKVSFLIINQ